MDGSTKVLKAPFPWFGGKRRVAAEVWRRFGDVRNYVEPFFGSGAVLLGRPAPFDGVETVNDLDGYVANFWRSVRMSPELTAQWADYPVNENDLHARHVWLIKQRDSLRPLLEGDPDYHDPKIAGWWVWGVCAWLGDGFCAAGNGPWWPDESGMLVNGGPGTGVSRRIIFIATPGRGVHRKHGGLMEWFDDLSARLRKVRVCSGDWSRVCTRSATTIHGMTGVFLDPPYADTADRRADIYASDSLTVAHDVRRWAIEAGKDPLMRIALCGYDGEHEMPDDWQVYSWKASGGYAHLSKDGKGRANAQRERIWFSPACLSHARSSPRAESLEQVPITFQAAHTSP